MRKVKSEESNKSGNDNKDRKSKKGNKSNKDNRTKRQPREGKKYEGVFQKTRRGFGYVLDDTGKAEDIFIAESQIGRAHV